MRNRRVLLSILAILAAALAPLAAPAGADEPRTALDCFEIKTDAERLACYDAVMADLVAERAASIEARAEIASAFGSEATADRDALSDIERMSRIEAAIVAHKVNANGMISVTLANGQVWRQIDGDRRIRALKPDVSYSAEIRRVMLGRYIMKIEPAGASMRVERTR